MYQYIQIIIDIIIFVIIFLFYKINKIKIKDYYKLNKQKRMIKKAIKEDRVIIYLQPIYSVNDKKYISAEVLARIKDKKGNIIYPCDFIEVAERTGIILELESMVFEKSCKFIKDNLDNLKLNYLEINLSVLKGESEKLIEEYDKVIKQYNISPQQLNLEITETATLQKRDKLINNMTNFIDYGLSFSLDDFGTGECNLNYIIDMPVSIIKFDKSIIDSYFDKDNQKAEIIIKNMINLAHKMDLKTIAEGIETKEQYNEIKSLNIDFIQGYYFSKPLSENDFILFIKQEKNIDN